MQLSQLLAKFFRNKSFIVREKHTAGNQAGRRRRRLALEFLEDRLAPAVTAVQVGTLLTVNFDATNDTATITGTDPSGSDITVLGTSLSSTTFTGVNSITVTQTPLTTNQALTLTTSASADAILAAGGTLSVTGIATTTVNGAINASAITGDAPTVNVQSGNSAKIQVGIDLAGASGTVNVADGTYTESNITVPESLTINGQSESGVLLQPAFADDHLDNAFGGTDSNGFVVQSNNVTIQNLTIDGNANLLLTGTQNFRAGVITDFNSGSQPFSGLIVDHVTVKNAFRAGIEVATQRVGGNANQILNDAVTGVTNTFHDGAALSLFGDATVTGNVLGGSSGNADDIGIAANIATAGAPSPVLIIQGNTLIDNTTGMNLAALAANSLVGGAGLGNGNTVTMNGSGQLGILLTFSAGVVTVQGNQITGSNTDSGVSLFDNSTAAAPLVVGNTISSSTSSTLAAGTGTGIFLFDDPTIVSEPGTGPDVATLQTNVISGFVRGIDLAETYATSPQNLTATLDGNTLINDTTGIRVLQTNTGATVTATFANTNTITGGTTGLLVSGSGTALAGNTLASTAFSGQTGLYIDLENGALAGKTIDATAATFEGNTGATNTLAQNFTVEAKLHHAVDAPTLGFIRILAGHVFVTTAKTINNGISAASAGDVVSIEAGTYAQAVIDNKGVNLTFTATNPPGLLAPLIINSLTGGGTSTLTLSGTLFTGDSTSTTYGGTISGGGILIKQGTGVFTLSGADNLTGSTQVQVGTLNLNGTVAGNVLVSSGTLGGVGTIEGTVEVDSGGTLSPGASGPGILTVAGVMFQSGSTLAVTLNGSTVGTGYSQLVVTSGPLALGNATLKINDGNSFVPNPGSAFTLISNKTGSATTSTFNGLPEGASITVNGGTGFLTYTGNSGNDVALDFAGPVSFTAGVTGSNFTLRRSGSSLQILVNGAVTDSRPLSAVTSLTFTGTSTVTNSLTIDFGFGGFFSLPGSVTFTGGTGGADALTVTGGVLQTTNVGYTGAGAGTLGLASSASGSLQVSFTNTTALDVSSDTNVNVNFQVPASVTAISITDNGSGASSTISGTNSTFVTTTYTDPTTQVLVTATGSDALTLKRTAATKASYVLDAGSGSNTLTVDFSSVTKADAVFLTAKAIDSTQFGSPIWYSATGGTFAGSVDLKVGSGGNFVIVQGTQSGAPTLVQTGSGNDNIIVSSDPNPLLGQLNNFASPLTVEAHGADHLIISNVTSTAADTVWVNSNAIAFINEGFVLWYDAKGGSFSRGVDVAQGSGADMFIVLSELSGTPTSLYGNGGDDTSIVAVTNASAYANLLLDGGPGNNTLQVFDQTGGGTVTRAPTTSTSGPLAVSYSGGVNSTINFQNMEQVFSNDTIQASSL